MNALLPVQKTHRLFAKHEEVALLCREALSQPANEANKAHERVLALLPQGIYRHYRGEFYFVIGIERTFPEWNRHESYVVHAIPKEGSHERGVRPWKLAWTGEGIHKTWFYPEKKRGKIVQRFRLIRRITFSKLLDKA